MTTEKWYGDCPTCQYHKDYRDDELVGSRCLHPAGELYLRTDTSLVSLCDGWRQNAQVPA